MKHCVLVVIIDHWSAKTCVYVRLCVCCCWWLKRSLAAPDDAGSYEDDATMEKTTTSQDDATMGEDHNFARR